MTSVDVVVPCYNYAHFLKRCVESILSQRGVRVRVLIIDDASTDQTAEIARDLACVEPRLEFRRHVKNRGHIATYNEGLLDWASAEYSLLLSADDALAPGSLERAARLMNHHPEVAMTYGMAIVIANDDAVSASVNSGAGDWQIVAGARFLQFCCEYGNGVPTPTAVVRTKVQQRIGGYSPELPHSGDLEMWMRFATCGAIGVMRDIQGYYRWHGTNMSSHYYARQLRDRRQVAHACERVIARWHQEPGSHLWLKSMYERLGNEAFWTASRAFDAGDTEACRAYIEFAEDMYPALRGSPVWWRFQAKRLLGQKLWKTVRPSVNRVRGLAEAPSQPRPLVPQQGARIGWWPGDAAGSPRPIGGDSLVTIS